SYMKGTIHEYYSIALAPGIAGTVAVGAWTLWRSREELASRVFLALSVAVTGVWAYELVGRIDWASWMRYTALVAGLLGAVVLLAWRALFGANENADRPVGAPLSPGKRALAVVALAATAFAMLGAPAAYALKTASMAHTGSTPLAGPGSSTRGG